MKRFFVLFIYIFVLSFFNPLLANNKAPRSKLLGIKAELRRSQPVFAQMSFDAVRPAIHPCSNQQGILAKANKRDFAITFEEGIQEILDSVNEIIKSGIQVAENEWRELQKELKEKKDSIHKKAEESIVEKLQKILVKLRKMEKALMENLADGGNLSKEKRENYRNNRENLEEKLSQLRKRIKEFTEDIEKEYSSLKEPISKKVQELLKEMEKDIISLQERLKRKSNTDKTLSI